MRLMGWKGFWHEWDGRVQLLVLSEDELKILHILKPLFG